MKLQGTVTLPDPNSARQTLHGDVGPRFNTISDCEVTGPSAPTESETGPSVSAYSSLMAILRTLPAAQISILVTMCAYAILFIYRTSFVIGGTRYFCLFDDDMISMRYGANLAHGYGLVWNPGHEKVEGFTNLLWVLYMTLVHFLPISAAKMSAIIQITGGLFLAINLVFVVAICDELFPREHTIATVAMVLTALDGPLNNWALQGTEVGVVTLGLTLSIWLALRAMKREDLALGLYAILGILTLFRLDVAVAAGAILLTLTVVEPRRWKEHVVTGGAILIGFLLAQLVFNLWYYGQALPNTYYLKMTGYPLIGRIRRGFLVGVVFLFPLIPLVVGTVARLVRRAIRPDEFLLVSVFAAQLAYSVWVGGDAWEWWGGSNRYISIAMPLFFILVSPVLVSSSLRISQGEERSGRAQIVNAVALTAIVCIAVLLVNAYRLKNNLLLEPPLQTAHPQPVDSNEDMVRRALLIDQFTERDATIAVVWAGSIPYFTDRYAIDLLGKNDAKIATEEMHTESALAKAVGFWPGHLKWDYDYSIGQLKPDVVVEVFGVQPERIPWLQRDYVQERFGGFPWYLRRGSSHIHWAALGLQQGAAITAK